MKKVTDKEGREVLINRQSGNLLFCKRCGTSWWCERNICYRCHRLISIAGYKVLEVVAGVVIEERKLVKEDLL